MMHRSGCSAVEDRVCPFMTLRHGEIQSLLTTKDSDNLMLYAPSSLFWLESATRTRRFTTSPFCGVHLRTE